ncbi:MAG: hypothetical protein LBE32_00975 [Burkholderiales bacterium]|jgi:hypothetical protein|nr:hypothetical protein [Burkholderiales bacterium]
MQVKARGNNAALHGKEYFAYTHTTHGILLLSFQPCVIKSLAQDGLYHGLGLIKTQTGGTRKHLICWYEREDDPETISISNIYSENGVWRLGITRPPVGKSAFLDIDSLPKSANFPK